ncbi:GntR family transcriptional regulator [Alcaligenaceae bacterium]|nr:GntR family transcriptional regulator [Alcaligenaceae bacterium]
MDVKVISLARGQRGDQVLQQLRTMAISYQLKPGEKLNEADLAKRLGVSRTPIREALMALAHEGFLDDTGRGYVRKNLNVQEMKNLYEARLALEKECCRYAIERATDEQIQELRHYCERSHAAEQSAPVKELVELDEGFHLKIAEMSGNIELVKLMEWIHQRIRFIRWISMDTVGRDATQRQHSILLDAMQERDYAAAEKLITAHISRRQDQIVDAVTKGLARIFL